MSRTWFSRFLSGFLFLITLCGPAFAYTKEVRLPIAGRGRYFAGSGSATYTEVIADNVRKGSRELVVEITNMPLPPGTVLVIAIEEKTIGRVTLDSRRSATFRLTAENYKTIPILNWGSQVNLTKVDGTIVAW